MKTELTAESPPESSEDEWEGHHRQTNVRDEDEKIDGPDPAVAGKFGVAVKVVIGDVTDQKEGREDSGAQHEAHVHDAVAAADVDVTANQTNGAERVEESVERGQFTDPFGTDDFAFEVDEPDEKRGNDGAEGQNDGSGFEVQV